VVEGGLNMIDDPETRGIGRGLQVRCPALNKLPPPPPGKVGWPWTEETPLVPDAMPDGHPWPLISVVTPSYNQGQFIEGTIRSVLLQGYPRLQYIVIDGGSTDGSPEVIRKYEQWLAYWASEPDRGQAHAINKGFQRATGEICAWLNSDDEYCRKALHVVARSFREQPDRELVYADCKAIDAEGNTIDSIRGRRGDLAQLLMGNFIPQPSTFFRRRAWETAGGLDVGFHFALDYDLWIRMMLNGVKSHHIPVPLSQFRWHSGSKSSTYLARFGLEYLAILDRVFQGGHGERVESVKLHAYHRAFRMIDAVYQREIEDCQGEISHMVGLWSRHVEKYQRDYMRNPRLWGESLYHIGKNYCFQGHMRQGRRFFSMALRVDKRAYKALVGWAMALPGVRPYRWYTKMRHALLRLLLRLNVQFPRTPYERVCWRQR